jgi:SNF2 family DNA or RNA helicase
MVSERNLTKEEKAKAGGEGSGGGRFKKLTAEVCNVHRLWKLLGPIVLRRRKQDAGEAIVPRIRRVVRCEMGTLQQKVYRYHLETSYLDRHGEKAIGAQLQALRMAAANPSSEHLQPQFGSPAEPCPCTRPPNQPADDVAAAIDIEGVVAEAPKPKKARPRLPAVPNCPRCLGRGGVPLPVRSGQAYIPKMATTLTLIEEILARQEQVVVFSAFNDPLDNLSRWLDDAQVRHVKLDGRVSQKARGRHALLFKRGRFASPTLDSGLKTLDAIPVMLAGVECMAEGHSFHLANNVILIAYSWAYDKFKQALDRVHRMTSTKPVNVYVVLCTGTIDRKLESLVQDKGDAAELVLDGRLIGERTEEVNLAELLHIAHREFDADTATLDEGLLHAQWPALRDRLARAMHAWDAAPGVPLAIPLTTGTTVVQASAGGWKERVAARAVRLAQTQRSSNLWSQF